MLRLSFLLLLPIFAFGFNADIVKIRGSTKPLENFDPLDLSLSNTDDRILNKFLEQHIFALYSSR